MKNGTLIFSVFFLLSSVAVAVLIENEFPSRPEIFQNVSTEKNFEIFGSGHQNTHHQEKKHYAIKMRYVPFQYFDRSAKTSNECVEDSGDDFPQDLFTDEQKKHGAVILHAFFGVYCFGLLAIVCNDYFLPCVQAICDKMNLSQDVAAATVMAFATSAPELCVNLIGTFVTKSDIGIGTIVGSAMFNTLGVAALGGLASANYMEIAWGPITRDSIIYVIIVTVLIILCWDGRIYWYETIILVVFYICYFMCMWSHKNISRKIKRFINRTKHTKHKPDEKNGVAVIEVSVDHTNTTHLTVVNPEPHRVSLVMDPEDVANDKILWRLPPGSKLSRAWFIFSWPLRFILYYTIPDHRKWPCGIIFTFVMCVFWIGANSYLVSWMITIIGQTMGVADFVMGLTLLAAGGCLPEATSIVILSMKGEGGMGVSNSLGANVQDILLALGLPWFIKAMTQLPDGVTYIPIGSRSLLYTITALILAVIALYLVIALNGYKLNKKVGIILICIYIVFLTAAIVMEIFLVNPDRLPKCT